MDNATFFAAVLPWEGPGYCSIHVQHAGASKFRGQYCVDIKQFLELIDASMLREALSTQHCSSTSAPNTWFCLARTDKRRRTRQHAVSLRALFADVDIGQSGLKYPTIPDAVQALVRICDKTSLPRPSAMVCSGTGLHLYWFSDRDLAVATWTAYAKAFKKLLYDNNFKSDPAVTADAVRLLRVPGTVNQKHRKPVFIIPPGSPGTKFDFAQVFSPLIINPSRRSPAIPSTSSLVQNLEPLKVDLDFVKQGCPWLRDMHASGGANETEPLWHHAVRCCVHIVNGESLVHELSDKHEGYVRDKCDQKYDNALRATREQNLGWPSCETIKSSGCTHCETCDWYKDKKSPLNLGLPSHAIRVRNEIEQLDGVIPKELMLPTGYGLDKDDQLCALIRTKTGNSLLVLIRNKIRNVTFQHYDNQNGVSFEAQTEHETWTHVFVGGVDAHSRMAATKAVRQGVVIDADKFVKDRFDAMTMSWVDVLRRESVAFRDAGLLGWRHDRAGNLSGFVYNGQLFRIGGSPVAAPAYGDAEFRRWYMPSGSREPWLKAARLLTGRQRPELDILISVAFAAPLMVFTGTTYGSILSVWGEPGTSKSTAQAVAAAVWGHPKQTRESLHSTPKSVQGRLGRIRNLPGYWDDIQTQANQEALASTMFVVAGGTEGGRLTAEADYRERKEWQTLLVCCSNTSFVDYMISLQKSTTAGMRRVFEIKFNKKLNEPGIVNGLEANRTFAALERNYGLIGEDYVRLLTGEKHEKVVHLVTDKIKSFMTRVEGTADESFWWSTCGVLIAGAMLASQVGANMDYAAMEEFLVTAFMANRDVRSSEGTEGGSLLNTEEALKSYINHYKDLEQVLFTETLFRHKNVKMIIRRAPAQARAIKFQVAVNERLIVIPRRALREHLVELGIGVRQILDGLKTYYKAEETKVTLGGGTSFAQAQEKCYVIPVPVGNIFESILTAYGDVKPDLQVVNE